MADDLNTPDVSAMTPEQAGAALDAMHVALHPPPGLVPQDAQDARQQLARLSADASWAQRLFGGDVATRRQWDELTAKAAEGDVVGDAVAGIEESEPIFETTMNGQLSRRAVASAVGTFREIGLSDASIEQALNLPPISRAEHAAAQAFQAKCHGSAEWRSRLLSGDHEATREHTLMCVLLSSPIAEDAA